MAAPPLVDLTPPNAVAAAPHGGHGHFLPIVQAAPSPAFQLLERVRVADQSAAHALRQLRGDGTPVVMHPTIPAGQPGLAMVNVPFVFDPALNGLQPNPHFQPAVGDAVANYCVDALIGHGAFSSVYAATSLEHGSRVSLKILNHGHLELETGLVEVAMHARILRADPQGQRPLLRMLACFYHRERLVLVTERLYGSVLAHYMHLETTGERAQYYTGATMASMARQMLDALGFLHALGVTHCDVKPANICLIDPVARTFKLIDFGHALTAHDVHASYAQSRWYRAPEVILGVPWGESVDVFGLALALAEAATGGALFQFGASALVLAAQRAVLGPLPAWMVQANPAVAQTVLTASGTAYEIDPPGMPAGAYLVRPTSGGGAGGGPVDASLGALLGARLDPAVFGDVEGFVGLLESLLALDPTQRPTAAQASSHAWLAAAAA